MLARIFIIAHNSTNNRNAIMCYGVAFYIFLHIIVNLMGVLGMMPMTGVPLPFLSYGGSFTICLIVALTMVQRVAIENNTKKIPYTLVIGDKEKEGNLVNYRLHGSKDTVCMNVNEFISMIKDNVKNYK